MSEESTPLVIRPTEIEAAQRLDAFLAAKIDGWSRARIQRLIENGDVAVNERIVKPSYKVSEGDEIEVDLTEIPAASFEAEDIPLDIIFEDEFLAVINKPAGMVVHPGAGVQSGTLANAIAWHFEMRRPARSKGDTASVEHFATANVRASAADHRVGIVHRLDKDTSGLIVVAKNEEIHEILSEQFRNRDVFKSYVALVHGSPRENSGKIDRPIARDKHNRTRMKIGTAGRSAISLWKVKQRFDKFTLLDVEIKTGRTHQIRVHLASLNHPIVGDEVYNEGRDNTVADIKVRNAINTMRRFFLHAEQLSFTHPKTGERKEFTQPLPDELTHLLSILNG